MWPENVSYFFNFQKNLPKVNNRPLGENSPIGRKFAQSVHTACKVRQAHIGVSIS
jgi:hypothetical protein